VKDSLDYTEEYKTKIRPEIIRWAKRVLLTFVGIVVFMFVVSKVLEGFKLSNDLINIIVFILFFSCGVFYIRQIYSLNEVCCPNCEKPLFYLTKIFKSNLGRRCPHCGAKFFK
jgi:hypothetical protein